MSDKPFKKLWKADQEIRRMFPTMMWSNDETILQLPNNSAETMSIEETRQYLHDVGQR